MMLSDGIPEIDTTSSIVRLALDAGATTVALAAHRIQWAQTAEARRAHQMYLCLRMGCHLAELERALGRSRHEVAARARAFAMAIEQTDRMLDEKARRPDQHELASWLEQQRKRFLMANTADAVCAADPLRFSREMIEQFERRLRRDVTSRLAESCRKLVATVEESLDELGESVRLRDLVRFNLTLPAAGWPEPTGDVVRRLEAESRWLVDGLIDVYEEARTSAGWRLCDVLDGILESSQVAVTAGYSRARLEAWSRTLSEISAELRLVQPDAQER